MMACSVSISSVATSAPSAAASSTASLSAAVAASAKTDITRALDALRFGLFGASRAGTALIAELGQASVSALRSPGSQGALASVSKAVTSDIGSVLNQQGIGAMAGSSQVADLVKTTASDPLAAAEATGYGETAAPASPAATTAAASVAADTAAAGTLAAIVSRTSSSVNGKSALANLGMPATKDPNLLAYATA